MGVLRFSIGCVTQIRQTPQIGIVIDYLMELFKLFKFRKTLSYQEIVLVAGLNITYPLIFILLYPKIGNTVAAASAVPLAIIGYLLGWWGGFLSGLIYAMLNLVLLYWLEGVSLLYYATGNLMVIFISSLSGWLAERIDKEKAVVKQSLIDQEILKEEIAEHERTKTVLAMANGELKHALARANELTTTTEALRNSLTAVNSTLDLDDVLDQIIIHIGTVISYDTVNIMLVEAGYGCISRHRGYSKEFQLKFRGLRVDISSMETFRLMNQTLQPCLVATTQQRETWVETVAYTRINSYVGAPIHIKGEVIGYLNLNSTTPGFYTPLQAQQLQAFAIQAALAIENAHLYSNAQREIAARQQTEAQLLHDTFHDKMTGLPNRILFMDHLNRSLGHTRRQGNYLCAVLVLDLDRFKVINESLGHLTGDQALVTIARRLEEMILPGDTVAYFGGDEFAILLDDLKHLQVIQRIANQVLQLVAQPMNLGGRDISITTSIGITVNAQSYWKPEDMIRDADTAMYRAKIKGGANYQIFDKKMYTQALRRLWLETDLRRAIECQELEVFYQPIVSLQNRQLTRLEALLRWSHPQHGFISPEEFVTVAEETGLIVAIGEWMIPTVCTQIKLWNKMGHNSFHTAINVSVRQFRSPNFATFIDNVLKTAELPYTALEIEVTESTAMSADELSTAPLQELNDKGIQISIDDFGIGYSSLSRLKSLPVNTLKVDQSFTKDLINDPNSQAIVAATIAMAHNLELKVIVEGVETEAQATFLREKQCDEAQGYLFGQPMSSQQLTKWLQQKQELPDSINTP